MTWKRDQGIVTCLGSSTTAGRGQLFDWISELQKRPRNAGYVFENFGRGGDLTWSALQRLPSVLSRRPDVVLLLIGGNDVLTRVFSNARRVLVELKRLPERPTEESFSRNFETIVRRLVEAGIGRIGLISLAPIGEDPASTDPVQHELNVIVSRYSEIIRRTADAYRAGYIPLHETLCDRLAGAPGKALTDFRFGPIYADTLRFFILRQSSDSIAARNGWRFHVDGVHLNGAGGMILADLVQAYLDES